MALAADRAKVVVLLLIFFLLPLLLLLLLLLLLFVCVCLFRPCFVMQYLMSFLVLQSFRCGRESWLLCFYCLAVVWQLVFLGSSTRYHGSLCSVWSWYLLVILTLF